MWMDTRASSRRSKPKTANCCSRRESRKQVRRIRIYAWLEKQDGDKERFENQRLLYVATTRAKERLHLLGSIDAVRDNQGGFD